MKYAVLVLSQVNRSPNGKNELPTNGQLKGGLGLNEVSDLTFFLHCPDLKNKEEMIVSVAKNRNQQLVKLLFTMMSLISLFIVSN